MHGGGGESVREHRNYLFQVARHGGGGKRVRVRKGPSASKYKVKIGCKDMEGRVTSGGHRPFGMLGKELGHEVPTSQMQYNADYKETDQKDQCFL